MKRILSLDDWPRKDHFHFFQQFEEPFFGLTVNVDATKLYIAFKERNASLFLLYLHCSLQAANETENFRYRIEGNDVIIYEQVNASPTINRPDGTFGFSYMDYHPSFETFAAAAEKEIEKVQQTKGLIPALTSENVIHYSSVPWINFTSLSHARAFAYKDSIPKISFGKIHDEGNKKLLPMSVHANHALMDGYHVGLYIERFQHLINSL